MQSIERQHGREERDFPLVIRTDTNLGRAPVPNKIPVLRTARTWSAAALAITLMGGLLGACSSSPARKSHSSSSPKSAAAAAVPFIRAMLPTAIKSGGALRVAATFGYPPDQYYGADNTTPTGISIDLSNAVAKVLGLRAQYFNVAFDSIVPGLLAGRYDTVMGSLYATPARVKLLDMVTYENAGSALLVSGGNPKHIAGLQDLCGLKLALLKGSAYISILQAKSTAYCRNKGKSAISFNIYNGAADYFQAVASGRADATYTGYEAARYAADNSGGKLTFIDKLYPNVPVGAACTKQNGQLAKAIQMAFNYIIHDGTYARIMAKWGVTKEAVSASELLRSNG